MLSTHVEVVHRRFGTVLEHELDRVGGSRDGVPYNRVHPREHVVRDADAHGRASDTDTHPDKVVSQPPDDGAKTVVSARAAADLDPHRASFKVEVVVDHDKI